MNKMSSILVEILIFFLFIDIEIAFILKNQYICIVLSKQPEIAVRGRYFTKCGNEKDGGGY
jgi:hypothetical protein